jgi:hypothetical protein
MNSKTSPARRFAGALARSLRGAAILLALAAAPALMAQEGGWSKSNFGFQLGYMNPMGDLADFVAPGFGAAAFYEKVFSNGFAARGRLEYAQFGEKTVEEGYYDPYYGSYSMSISTKLTQVGVMVDAIYYPKLKDTIYPFAGIGYFNRTVDATASAGGYTNSASADLDSELAFCIGMGVNFSRHFGMELKYTECDDNWIQLSLLYRF